MLSRIRQLITALGARITPEEHMWVEEMLSEKYLPLFYGMDTVDQRHGLDVAATAMKYSTPDVDAELLIKAALLHDCGKLRGSLSTPLRIFVVIANGILGSKTQKFVRESRDCGALRHALWLYHNHPQLGAEMARKLGAEQALCDLIAGHHIPPGLDSSAEHKALYSADQKN